MKLFLPANIIEIYTDAPERRRECLYFLAIGNFKISNYSEARRFNDQLLKLEPRNDQALTLKQLIDEKVSTGNVLPRAQTLVILTAICM
jgi:fission 1 protein